MIKTPTQSEGKPKPVKSILISQPKPERSPYYNLEQKFGLQIDFRQFIHVEDVTAKEFRKHRINPADYSSIVFTSRNSIEHFFRMCEEFRIKINPDLKYFCLSESIAHYLQKFIVYRKRKVFFGKRTIEDMQDALKKHKEAETFLLPCSNLGRKDVAGFLTENKFNYQEAELYRTVASDLSDLKNITYDMLVFFSPLGISSLYDNFPDFIQKDTRIAAFGSSTCQAVLDRNLVINIKAPLPEAPSMTMAIERYLQKSNV